MKSIKELYRIGTGPSSSHTMGPRKAAEMFLERHPDAASFKVTLYGSLAATGKGHMTDVAIIDTLQPTAPVEIVWQPKVFLPFHPNGMTFAALDSNDKVQENWTVYSIGGGTLAVRKKIYGITCKKYGKPCRQPFAADWNRKAYCPVH